MRIVRRILIGLLCLLGLVALLAGVALLPPVQTWLLERSLNQRPGLQATVGSVSAGWSRVQVTDLRLKTAAGVLIVPALDATLPVAPALWDRSLRVQSLSAKGWTLDLSGQPTRAAEERQALSTTREAREDATAPGTPSDTTAVEKMVAVVHTLLGGELLPYDLALDGLTLDGDVLLPGSAGNGAARVHVSVQGGGLAVGHVGEFTLEASAVDAKTLPKGLSAHGRLSLAMAAPRRLGQINFEGSLSAQDRSLPSDLRLALQLKHAGRENFAVALTQGARRLVTLAGEFGSDGSGLSGAWTVDLRDIDLPRLRTERAWPSVAAQGEGKFETDPAFARVRTNGRLNAAISHLDTLFPAMHSLSEQTLELDFAVEHQGQAIRVDRLRAALAGTGPRIVVQSDRPFSVDERTGRVTTTDPGADWLHGTLTGLPLACLSDLAGALRFTGSDLTGEFGVKTTPGGIAVYSKAPFVATGVSVQQADRLLGRGLDVSLPLAFESTAPGWRLRAGPMTMGAAGKPIAVVEAEMAPDERNGIVLSGKWQADLELLAAQSTSRDAQRLKGRSTSGEASVRFGRTTDISSKLNLASSSPAHTIALNVRAVVDSAGGINFKIPATITVGDKSTTVTAGGDWWREKNGSQVDLILSGVDAALPHLQLLASSLSEVVGFAWPGDAVTGRPVQPPGMAAAQPYPFWGDCTGQVKFDCYHLRGDDEEWYDIAGTVKIDPRAVRLEAAHATLPSPASAPQRALAPERGPAKTNPRPNQLTAAGELSWHAGAAAPYELKLDTTGDVVDTTRLFAGASAGGTPVIEGRFSLVHTITSRGADLSQLVGRRQEEFRLTGKDGILRLLKTDVAHDLPQEAMPTKDALLKVGTSIGYLLGINKDAIDPGTTHLSKATEAVLEFTLESQELRYDELKLTATRSPDQAIRLTDLEIRTSEARVTGTGEIAAAAGQPLRARPLQLTLEFGFQGHLAQLLSTAGLLATAKDDRGYTPLRQPLQFGGTLGQVDQTQWHDLLLKAAMPVPAEKARKGR